MLRSEMRALRNTFRTKEGQQALVGTIIVLLCLTVGGLALGSMLTRANWLGLVQDPASGMLAAVCGAMLLLPAVLVIGFGRIPCRAQLFDGSHVPAWLASPAGTHRIIGMVWLRQVVFALVSASSIAAVPVVAVVVRARLPWSTAFGFLLMLALVMGACVAVVILTMVAATRFGSAPRWRRMLLLLHLSMTVVAMVLMLSGFTRGEGVMRWLADSSPSESSVAAFLAVAAALPAQLAAGDVGWSALHAVAVLVGITGLALGGAACIYRSAFEARLGAAPTVSTQRSGVWPSSAVASLVRRGFCEAWRARGNLALVALFGAGVVWRVASNPFEPSAGDPMGLVREVFFLQSGWLSLACILAMLLFLGVVGDEQKQLPLLATSPLARRDLLRSRVILLGWPLLLTVLLTAFAGALVGGVGWSGALFYLAASLPFALVLLGSTLAVGSWPTFIQVQSGVPLASNVRSVVPVLVLSVVSGFLLFVHHIARKELIARGAAQTEWLGTALLLLLAVWASAIGCYVLLGKMAHRNLTRLLGPQA